MRLVASCFSRKTAKHLVHSDILLNFATRTKLKTIYRMIGLGMQNILLFGLGMQEILVIALIVLLLFGGKKIPELMKGLGKGVKSFKEGMNEVTDITKDEGKEKKDE